LINKITFLSHAELARYRDLGFHDQTTEILPEPRVPHDSSPSPDKNRLGDRSLLSHAAENIPPDRIQLLGRLSSPPQRNSTPYPAISPIQVVNFKF
jgi:hypothetical protein